MLNLVQVQERLKGVPMQALMSYANGASPAVPPYLALGELNRRKKMQEEVAAEQAQQAEGAPSIKQQIEQQAGLIALQGNRMQQAAQNQQQAQESMPMPAPNTTMSEPAQMAAGGAVNDVVVPGDPNLQPGGPTDDPLTQRDFQVGGPVRPQMNPEMLKRLMMLKAMQQRQQQKPGVTGLPMRPDMLQRRNFAGGGIVAFAGPSGSYVDPVGKNPWEEDEGGLSRLREEVQQPSGSNIQDLFKQLIQKKMAQKSLEDRLKEAGVTQAPEAGKEELAAIQGQIAKQQEKAPMDQLMEFLGGVAQARGGNWATQGAQGVMASRRLAAQQEAGLSGLQMQMAKIKDLKAKAAYESARGNIKEAMANEDAASKELADYLAKAGKVDLESAQAEQARAGKATNLDKVFAAIDEAKRNPTEENVRRANSMIAAAGAVTYQAPKVEATYAGMTADKEKLASQQYASLFDPKKPMLGPLGAEMRAAAAKDKITGGTENQNAIRLREYNLIRGQNGLPPVSSLPGSATSLGPKQSDPLGIR